MFIITPKDPMDLTEALQTLTQYSVSSRIMQIGNDLVFVVHDEGEQDALRMCEMEFQMNFHQQGGRVCPFCAKEEGLDFCGHLTFTRRIG